MNEKFPLIGSGRIRDSFKNFVDRKIRERRRDERRLYEQRTTAHQLLARNSCVADARSYRIARRFPVKSFAVINQSAG
jgi:type VI protein secretion system component VasF